MARLSAERGLHAGRTRETRLAYGRKLTVTKLREVRDYGNYGQIRTESSQRSGAVGEFAGRV